MRRFSARYLEETRRGLWDDDRSALDGLDLPNRRRVLDVGCGLGAFGQVLLEESDAALVSLDGDPAHLDAVAGTRVGGDARRLPLTDDAVDLVACQMLLVNLRDPVAALEEFSRVSSELVAAVEPNNADVSIESSVDGEAGAAERARSVYRAGFAADDSVGASTASAFADAGLSDVDVRTHRHERVFEPPYTTEALVAARRKLHGSQIRIAREELVAGAGEDVYRDLLETWRGIGRETIRQMAAGTYRRRETVPIHVAVGRS